MIPRNMGFFIYNNIFIYFNLFLFNVPIIIISLILLIIFFIHFLLLNLTLKKFKNKDPQEIVIDEFIGQSIPIIFI